MQLPSRTKESVNTAILAGRQQAANPIELYTNIENLLPILTRTIANLATILGIGADRLNLYERHAKDNARAFWDLNSAVAWLRKR